MSSHIAQFRSPRHIMTCRFLTAWSHDEYQALENQVLLAKHRLHQCGLFDHDNLIRILDQHPERDLGINTMGDRASRFEWREGRRNGVASDVLLDLVRRGRLWINVRKVLDHHPAISKAVNAIYDELELRSPGFKAQQRSANLLISSPGAIVHYHLDVPVNMLWHIRGVKRVWVYPLNEHFVSQHNIEGICSGEFGEDLPYDASFDEAAQVFDVQPGQMLTWPQNTPHRVANLEGMNVSLSTEHKNPRALRLVNVHLANQYLRRTFGLPCRSTSADGPLAHAKQSLIRCVRRLEKFRGLPTARTFKMPITFQVDPHAPLGYSLLDEHAATRYEEFAGV